MDIQDRRHGERTDGSDNTKFNFFSGPFEGLMFDNRILGRNFRDDIWNFKAFPA